MDKQIEGSVVVANYTDQDFTLTVIVMAVNQIGRATALGYQEFTLASGEEQAIPFGSSPGPGTTLCTLMRSPRSRARTRFTGRASRRPRRW